MVAVEVPVPHILVRPVRPDMAFLPRPTETYGHAGTSGRPRPVPGRLPTATAAGPLKQVAGARNDIVAEVGPAPFRRLVALDRRGLAPRDVPRPAVRPVEGEAVDAVRPALRRDLFRDLWDFARVLRDLLRPKRL